MDLDLVFVVLILVFHHFTVLFAEKELAAEHVNWAGAAIFLAAFLLLRKLKWNPVLVMALCGISYLGINLII